MAEPIFVRRPGCQREDDGWVLALVYDAAAHRSDVVILDASDLFKRAIACISSITFRILFKNQIRVLYKLALNDYLSLGVLGVLGGSFFKIKCIFMDNWYKS